jgi:hypothetical protein
MSRIRSIHPGLWTDEAFVSLSPMARLLIMGIWNECDDMGSFAWSPLTLKMRILPADNADAGELLAEMVSAGIVKRYEIAGKSYGAVRNFCQFQRPKKPNSVHPQTDEIREWVNTEARSTRDGAEEVPNQLPTASEIVRQMEDGGGVKEGCSDEQPEARRARPATPKSKGVEVPDWMPAEPWAAFKEMRRKMRGVPFTETAERTVIGKIATLKAEGHDPAKLLTKAVERGHRTVFEDETTRGGKNGKVELSPQQLRERAEWFVRHGQPDRADECRQRAIQLEQRTTA